MTTELTIGTHAVGTDHPTYFVADIAANHDGDLSRAKTLVHLAAAAGADAAKFQNFRAHTIVSDVGFRELGAKLSHQSGWKQSVTDVYRAATVPVDWAPELKSACDDAGIDYFTAPYDLELIDDLAPWVCAWKVGSGDITWHALIDRLARDGKPLLLATGASTLAEVHAAVAVAQRHCHQLVLMQCNTNYTGAAENIRYTELRVLDTFRREFPGIVLGLSDHTAGHATVLGAVTLGARVVEKHFTDDRGRTGPDHPFSMAPDDWREMVDRTRELESALGLGEKRVMGNEAETVVLQRRAVRAARRIPAGAEITADDLVMLRPCPGDALPPHRSDELVAHRARHEIEVESCLRPDDVD